MNGERVGKELDSEEDSGGADTDDSRILDFGELAPPGQARVVTALVRRYYAAMDAHDGAEGCSLLYSSISETLVENYGETAHAPLALRGRSCSVVLSKMFARSARRAGHEPVLRRVIEVRVSGNKGVALLDFAGEGERHIQVHREYGVWKIGELSDSVMP